MARRWALALAAAAASLLLNLLLAGRHHVYPLGHRSRGFGDYGTQYIEFHTAFRRLLLHQTGLMSPTFTWTSGGGVPFLPDYAYYLGGPFTPLVAVFPAGHVELAVFCICIARLALASALMALLVRRLRPHITWWLPVVLGTLYSSSAWVYDIALYTPMWLDALWNLPLLVLAGLWCLERRRFGASVAVVALSIWSNYYTGYMACLGAGVITLALALERRAAWRATLAGLLRFLVAGLLGVGCMAWLLVPTLTAVHHSVPFPPPGHENEIVPVPWAQVLGRFLPATEGLRGTPALYVGSFPLVLALSLPFARHRPARVRATWAVFLVLVVLSSNVEATMKVWNAFDVPQGNLFRFSFVVTGFLVVVAAQAWPCPGEATRAASGAARDDPEVVGGATSGRTPRGQDARPASWPPVLQALGGSVLLGILLLRWGQQATLPGYVVLAAARHYPIAVGLVLLAGSVACTVVPRGAAAATRAVLAVAVAGVSLLEVQSTYTLIARQVPTFLATMPVVDTTKATSTAARLTREAGWPLHRATSVFDEALPWQTRFNQGLLLDQPSFGYYSSNQPLASRNALASMGFVQPMSGRMSREHDERDSVDPALDQILGIVGPSAALTGVHDTATMPIARTLAPASPPMSGNTFVNRNQMLGRPVYRVSHITVAGHDQLNLPLQRRSSTSVGFECHADEAPALQFHLFTGVLRPAGQASTSLSQAMVVQFAPGTTRVQVVARLRSQVVAAACLDQRSLSDQVARTPVPRVEVTPNHIRAHFDAPQQGQVVFAVPHIDGWSCRVDGRATAAGGRLGFLAVTASGAREVACSYREPGVRAGLLASAVLTLCTVALALVLRRRRSPEGAPDAGPDSLDGRGAHDAGAVKH